MFVENKDQVIFVCYETNPKTGSSVVTMLVDTDIEAKEFKLQSLHDKISRSVEAFVVWSIGSSMSRKVPEEIKKKVEEINNL